MRKELLTRLLSAFDKDKNSLIAFELATEHLSDEELQVGVKKCLAMHTKSILLPADLVRYALSERVENARNTLFKAASLCESCSTKITFEDLALCSFVERHGGLDFFREQSEDYFFGEWGKKAFADKFIEIATSEPKKHARYIYKHKNAEKYVDKAHFQYLMFDSEANKNFLKNEEQMQLFLRDEKSTILYLEEKKAKERLQKLFCVKKVGNE